MQAVTWSIQPNPASDNAMVTELPQDAQIRIMDLNGKLLTLSLTYNDGSCIIPVHALAEGVYLLQVVNAGQVFPTRFLVQHGR